MAAGHESPVYLKRSGPCPLWLGFERIAAQLRTHAEIPTGSAAPSGLVRIQIEVDGIVVPVHWLSHQHITPQLYFSARSDDSCLAGVGAAHRFTEPAVAPPRGHYYGTTRFKASRGQACSPEWEAFGDATWVLPLCELHAYGDDGICTLACNLYWEEPPSPADRKGAGRCQPSPADTAVGGVDGNGAGRCQPGRADTGGGGVEPSNGAEGWASSLAQAARTALDVLGRVSRAVEPVPRQVWQLPLVFSRAEGVQRAMPSANAVAQAGLLSQREEAIRGDKLQAGTTPKSDATAQADRQTLETPTKRVQLHLSHPLAPIHVVEWLVNSQHSPAPGEPTPPQYPTMLYLQLSCDVAILMLQSFKERLGEPMGSIAIAADGSEARVQQRSGEFDTVADRMRAPFDSLAIAAEAFDSRATAADGSQAQTASACPSQDTMPSAAAATPSTVRAPCQGLPAAAGEASEGEGFDRGMHAGRYGRRFADRGEYRRPSSTTLFHRDKAFVFSSTTAQSEHPAASHSNPANSDPAGSHPREVCLSSLVAGDSLAGGAPPPQGSDFATSVPREVCLSSLIAADSLTGGGPPRLPFSPHTAENLNILSATLLFEELGRCGLCHVVLCPGSRSAPLAIALSRSGLRHTIALDERGAGFMAVGLARVTGRAAAVVVSSGTAVVNLHPSVIEAAQDNVPLLLLTADRPPELRDTKANQTIDQVSLFGGGALRWFKDVPCPEAGAALEPLLADASYAMARAHGCSSCPAGAVQLNLMFREPLSPKIVPWPREPLFTRRVAAWVGSSRPFTVYSRPLTAPMPCADGLLAPIVGLLVEARRGVIVAGSLRNEAERLAVAALGSRLGWPVLADVCSGLRRPHRDPASNLFAAYLDVLPDVQRLSDIASAPLVPLADLLLAARTLSGPLAPDVCLQIGGRIVGRRLQGLAASANSHIVIEPHGERCDPLHSVTHSLQGSIAQLLCSLHAQLGNRKLAPSPLLTLCTASRALEAALTREIASDDILSEVWVCRHVTEVLTTPCYGAPPTLFSSNSGPIRHLDTYCSIVPPVLCNRGASGIDGILHTALGVALAHAPANCTLLIGDLAALHDLSGLALLSQQVAPLTVVILNNAGGGIFRSLPIAQYPDIFSPYFDTPHPHRFGLACQGFGLQYNQASTRDSFADAYKEAQKRSCPTIIEVVTGPDEHAPLAARMTAVAREVAGTFVL